MLLHPPQPIAVLLCKGSRWKQRLERSHASPPGALRGVRGNGDRAGLSSHSVALWGEGQGFCGLMVNPIHWDGSQHKAKAKSCWGHWGSVLG